MAAGLALASCASPKAAVLSGGAAAVAAPEAVAGGKAVNALPKATAFRMSGDYAGYVAITLGDDGKPIWFPDPRDITEAAEPLELCDGWWLNRQGLGPNSVFTSYTFARYRELPEVPSPAQLLESVIPGARVTGFVTLPCLAWEATDSLALIEEFLQKQPPALTIKE